MLRQASRCLRYPGDRLSGLAEAPPSIQCAAIGLPEGDGYRPSYIYKMVSTALGGPAMILGFGDASTDELISDHRLQADAYRPFHSSFHTH